MPPDDDLVMRVEREIGLAEFGRRQEFGHRLKHFTIDDQFLEIGDKAALAPAGGMIDQVAVPVDRAPQRHLGFPHGLGVDGVRRAAGAGPIGKAVAPRQLAAGDVGEGIFRRAEGRGARLHVDIRGEAAIDHRRAGPHQLCQRDAEQRLCILLCQGACQGHRRHRAHQGERGDHRGLAHLGHHTEHQGWQILVCQHIQIGFFYFRANLMATVQAHITEQRPVPAIIAKGQGRLTKFIQRAEQIPSGVIRFKAHRLPVIDEPLNTGFDGGRGLCILDKKIIFANYQ